MYTSPKPTNPIVKILGIAFGAILGLAMLTSLLESSSDEPSYLDRTGSEREEIRRGLTAGTFQHELDHLDGTLFLDRVADPRTLTTWAQFERFHREAFAERARRLIERVGS